MTVTASATITSVSLASTGGLTGLLVGSTNQLIATCHYSDGSTTNCTTTDSHGNVAGSWTSTTPAKATISSGGLFTGVAQGNSTFTAAAGGHTSSALPLAIIPNGTYTITITGKVKFSGRVTFGGGVEWTFKTLLIHLKQMIEDSEKKTTAVSAERFQAINNAVK